jgi:hypothetical protein
MNSTWDKFRQVIERHRITFGVILALLIAMVLTSISMALYISSGASRLDLSRPGYESARNEVVRSTDSDSFNATGPMNTSVANDFQNRFTKHRDTLNKLDTYGTTALDDNELQIAPSPSE